MRVLMAILALRKWDAGIVDSRLLTAGDGFWLVALGARHALVSAVQRVLGLSVIEVTHVLPLRDHVAALAGGAQLAAVLVLVAARARGRQSQVSSMQVLHANALARLGRDVFRTVASLAVEMRMAAFERIAGFAVVELIQADFPQDRHKVLAIVLGVALDAGIIAGFVCHQHGMQSLLVGQPPGDFRMTPGAFELAIPRASHVTARTVGGTFKPLVRP